MNTFFVLKEECIQSKIV